MKRLVKIFWISAAVVAGALIVFVLTILLLDVNRKHSPRAQARILKTLFGVNLKDFDYSVRSFSEKWYFNGDGKCEIVFDFKQLTLDNLDYLRSVGAQPLPLPDSISYRFPALVDGYYMYDSLFGGYPNYKLLLIDTDHNTATLRYEMF